MLLIAVITLPTSSTIITEEINAKTTEIELVQMPNNLDTDGDMFYKWIQYPDMDWTGMDIGKASTVQNRLDNNKYSGWTRYGENIAAGTERDTAQKAIDAWLKSDSHCAILMDPNFTEVGMAHAENIHAHYTHYWTQNFGSR